MSNNYSGGCRALDYHQIITCNYYQNFWYIFFNGAGVRMNELFFIVMLYLNQILCKLYLVLDLFLTIIWFKFQHLVNWSLKNTYDTWNIKLNEKIKFVIYICMYIFMCNIDIDISICICITEMVWVNQVGCCLNNEQEHNLPWHWT